MGHAGFMHWAFMHWGHARTVCQQGPRWGKVGLSIDTSLDQDLLRPHASSGGPCAMDFTPQKSSMPLRHDAKTAFPIEAAAVTSVLQVPVSSSEAPALFLYPPHDQA